MTVPSIAMLFGFGAHGHDIFEIWSRVIRVDHQNHPYLTICDEDPALECLPAYNAGYTMPAYIGINDPSGRKKLVTRLGLYGGPPLIDPSAVVGKCLFGRGVVIAPGAVLLGAVNLGDHVHVNYGASMTRCNVGDYSTISPGAVICGDVNIGSETLIGAGAIVCDRVFIGNRVTVGAGAVIPPKSVVPDDTTVIGVWKP